MEEENELLRFIRNYNGDFYYDFPVVLELICKEDRKEEYDNFKIRYSGSSKITENHQGEFYQITVITNLRYILENGLPTDLNYISKYYNNEELIINRSSNLMQLIRRIQDEVHRFAITYHRSLRDKRTLHSVLDDIPNVGEKRRRALLMKFGSVDNIKNATLEQLLETPSINNKAAESIYQYFNGNESK